MSEWKTDNANLRTNKFIEELRSYEEKWEMISS